jgi:hypothetical protein
MAKAYLSVFSTILKKRPGVNIKKSIKGTITFAGLSSIFIYSIADNTIFKLFKFHVFFSTFNTSTLASYFSNSTSSI